MELYKKYRPQRLKEVLGQLEAVRTLQGFVENGFPHALMFSGPSGCGKTTLTRICATKLDCHPDYYVEKDCATFRGIDTVRDIEREMHAWPLIGNVRIYYIDEAHQLTKDAQNALLKMLEDTESHVYFMLSTTEPQKLITPIITRCTEIKVQKLKAKILRELVDYVLTEEKVELSADVKDKIVEYSEGSARKALVLLNQVYKLEDEEEQLQSVFRMDHKANAFELAKLLIWTPRPNWSDVSKLLKDLEDDPEGIRLMMLSCSMGEILKGGNAVSRALMVFDYFQFNFYDTKKPGLVRACYNVCHHK